MALSNIQFIVSRFHRMLEAMLGFHLMGRKGSNFQEEILYEYLWVSILFQQLTSLTKQVIGFIAWFDA